MNPQTGGPHTLSAADMYRRATTSPSGRPLYPIGATVVVRSDTWANTMQAIGTIVHVEHDPWTVASPKVTVDVRGRGRHNRFRENFYPDGGDTVVPALRGRKVV